MATDFGFEPTKNESGYYFISYNTEDCERVGKIVKRLHSSGLPIWYDKGIEHNELWKTIIAEKISNCKEVILFFTNGIIEKSKSTELTKIYTYKEYTMASKKYYDKKVLIVTLDDYDDKIPTGIADWMIELSEIQGIDASSISSAKEIADMIVAEIKNDGEENESLKESRTSQNKKFKVIIPNDSFLDLNENYVTIRERKSQISPSKCRERIKPYKKYVIQIKYKLPANNGIKYTLFSALPFFEKAWESIQTKIISSDGEEHLLNELEIFSPKEVYLICERCSHPNGWNPLGIDGLELSEESGEVWYMFKSLGPLGAFVWTIKNKIKDIVHRHWQKIFYTLMFMFLLLVFFISFEVGYRFYSS